MLQQSLGSLKILAPHDGLVMLSKDETGKTISVGETRWPGYTLMTIPDTSSMKARAQVLESDAGNVRVGQSAVLKIDSHPETRFDATVETVDLLARQPNRDSPVKYFEVVLRVSGYDPAVLKPGKLLRAEITTASYDNVVVVPRVAIVEESLKHYIWIDGPGAPAKRGIEIGSGDTARVVIRAGADEGDAVLLNPPRSSDSAKEQGQKNAQKNTSTNNPAELGR